MNMKRHFQSAFCVTHFVMPARHKSKSSKVIGRNQVSPRQSVCRTNCCAHASAPAHWGAQAKTSFQFYHFIIAAIYLAISSHPQSFTWWHCSRFTAKGKFPMEFRLCLAPLRLHSAQTLNFELEFFHSTISQIDDDNALRSLCVLVSNGNIM